MIREHVPIAGPALSQTAVEAVVELWHQSGKTSIISVTGRSMLPFIRSGDKLLVSHHKRRTRIGDVITFYQAGRLVVHRVIRCKTRHGKTRILTKGDNAPRFDAPICSINILGRVVALERNGQQLLLNAPACRITGWIIALKAMMRKHVATAHKPKYRAKLKRIFNRCFVTFWESC